MWLERLFIGDGSLHSYYYRGLCLQALERPKPETIICYAWGLVSAAIAVPGVGMQQAVGSSDNM